MGFGLLFIGYFLEYLIGMNDISVFTHLLGYMVMFAGLSQLRLYCRAFSYAQYCTVPLMLLAIYRTFAGLPELFDISFTFVTEARTFWITLADLALVSLFHVLLAIAIMEICNRTGVKKNAVIAIRNLLIVFLYDAAYVGLTFSSGKSVTLYGVTLLLQLIWVIGNLVLIGSCYMRICPAGQENMDKQRSPSRIPWIARLQEKYQKSEDKAIAQDKAYRKQRYDEQVQKFNQAKRGNVSNSRAAKRAEVEAAREAARRRREQDL